MIKKVLKVGAFAVLVISLVGGILFFQPDPKTIGDLIESYVNPGIKIKTRSPFSGTVLVAKDGEVIFKDAYGNADRETNKPNALDTKFGIGSVTKQFTAMLIMQLVAEQKLALDDSIGSHLSYLSEEKAEITIHELLSHTSGLPHYQGLAAIGVPLREFGKTRYSPKELVELIDKTQLLSRNGKEFHYSSLGFHVLGAILEEITGKPFADLVEERIAKPLKLTNTGFGSNEYVAANLAKGYRYREVYGFDWWVSEHGGEILEVPFRDQSTAYAAGGLHSTVEDLFVWSEAIKSHKLLSPNLTKVMLTPSEQGYCYGWVRNWDDIVEKNINARLYGHGGALAGNSAFIALYDDGTTIIYLANRNNLKAEEILHQVHLRANGLKDEYRLEGYPNRSSYERYVEAGGMAALQNYFDRLSEYSGYVVHPSTSTMRGVMKIHLEAGKIDIADSLKSAFFQYYNPDERTLNQFGYDFLYSEYPEYALAFFKQNTEKFPFSANTWDSLGEAYLLYSEYSLAISSFRKAVTLGEKYNHESLKIFRENLAKANEMLRNEDQ